MGFTRIGLAQVDYKDLCENAQRPDDASNGFPPPIFQPIHDSMWIEGAYWLDGYQGSEERGHGFGKRDEIIAVFDDPNAGPIIKGNTFPNSHSGAFSIQVVGDRLYDNAEAGIRRGDEVELVLCDYYGFQYMEPIPLMTVTFSRNSTAYDWVEPRARTQYNSDGELGMVGKTDMVARAGSHSSTSTEFSVTVGVHGIFSTDMNGRLDVWYRRDEAGQWKEDRIAQVYPTWTTPEGHAVFDVALEVDDDAENRALFFTHTSVDPRTGHDHFGYALGAVPFKPTSTDFEFLGNVVRDEQPWGLLLSHPPQFCATLLETIRDFFDWNYTCPGRSDSEGSDVAGLSKGTRQVDLYPGVIRPTGQPIHFNVTEADFVTTEVEGSILTVSYPDTWTGLDRLRLEMTHDTGELTVREFNFLVVSDEMNIPDWTAPNPDDYAYAMTVIAEFDESAGITMQDGPVLGAFVDGELAGVGLPREVDGRVLLVTDVYSNQPDSGIELVSYTVSGDELVPFPDRLTMQDGGSYGSLWQPLNLGSISTSRESGESQLPRDLRISSVFPNPAAGELALEYSARRAGPVSVYLVDMLGRRSLVHRSTHVGAGEHTLRIAVGDYSAGMYRVVVESGGKRDTQPVTLIAR